MSVDLPDPFWPTSACTRPAWSASSTSSSARWPGKTFVTCSTWRSGVPDAGAPGFDDLDFAVDPGAPQGCGHAEGHVGEGEHGVVRLRVGLRGADDAAREVFADVGRGDVDVGGLAGRAQPRDLGVERLLEHD